MARDIAHAKTLNWTFAIKNRPNKFTTILTKLSLPSSVIAKEIEHFSGAWGYQIV